MELFINNKSGAPIYDQIYNQIRPQMVPPGKVRSSGPRVKSL